MIDHRQTERAAGAWRHFVDSPLDRLLAPAERSGDAGFAAAALARELAQQVPAYGALLKEQMIDPASIRDGADLPRLPLLTKDNYIRRFPIEQRLRGGRLESCDMVAVSSGSTGEPTLWPRFQSDEAAIAVRFEQVLRDQFQAHEKRSLAVVCFALGAWVGGLYTLSCLRLLAAKGYPLFCVAPGNNQAEIWRAVRALAPKFEQTILFGYPPFLRDVVEGGIADGLDWSPYDVKLVMAGEVFSEEWRALMRERLGARAHPCYGSASLYGTADAGVLGNETPLTVAIRRFLAQHPPAARELFGESRLPTLAQYDPFSRYFEALEDGTLAFSGDNGVPLMRYHIADRGGVTGYDEMLRFCRDWRFDPMAELAAHSWSGARRLPFVHVFGRADFTVSFFGANIYPENVTVGLEQSGIAERVTGKFVLRAIDEGEAPHLAVAVELAPKIEPTPRFAEDCQRAILDHLLRLNSEYANYVPPDRRRIAVTLHPTGDPDWFPIGVKHRYSRR